MDHGSVTLMQQDEPLDKMFPEATSSLWISRICGKIPIVLVGNKVDITDPLADNSFTALLWLPGNVVLSNSSKPNVVNTPIEIVTSTNLQMMRTSSWRVDGYSYSTLTQAVTAQVESTGVLKLPEFFSVDGASLEQCTLTLTFDVAELQSLSATHYIFVVKKSTAPS